MTPSVACGPSAVHEKATFWGSPAFGSAESAPAPVPLAPAHPLTPARSAAHVAAVQAPMEGRLSRGAHLRTFTRVLLSASFELRMECQPGGTSGVAQLNR